MLKSQPGTDPKKWAAVMVHISSFAEKQKSSALAFFTMIALTVLIVFGINSLVDHKSAAVTALLDASDSMMEPLSQDLDFKHIDKVMGAVSFFPAVGPLVLESLSDGVLTGQEYKAIAAEIKKARVMEKAAEIKPLAVAETERLRSAK